MKRLALTKEGTLTYCVAKDENIGKGRCNHIAHKRDEESVEEFVIRAEKDLNNSIRVLDLKNLIDVDGLNTIPNATLGDDGVIRLNEGKSFGSPKMVGNQFKGDLIIDNKGFTFKKFVKLDRLNPLINGHWRHGMDYSNSSITEDICSRFIESISNTGIKSVLYNFSIFDLGNGIETGTISDNYMEENVSEELAIAPNSEREDMKNFRVTFDEYYDNVATENDYNKILESMIDFFGRYRVKPDVAKKFIIQQAGLDLILGNEDRKKNPSNFIFLIPSSIKKDVIPLNMDYGRCLQIFWTETSESRIEDMPDSEDVINEIVMDEVKNFSGGGLFGGNNLKESVDFLIDNGFRPFNLDKEKFLASFNNLEEKISKHGLKFKNYLKLKKKFIEEILDNKEIKRMLKGGY